MNSTYGITTKRLPNKNMEQLPKGYRTITKRLSNKNIEQIPNQNMQHIIKRAVELGVVRKIDQDEPDDVQKWSVLLEKFSTFKKRCCFKPQGGVTISTISEDDIHLLRTDQSLYDRVVSELHVDHSGVFPTPRGKATPPVTQHTQRGGDAVCGTICGATQVHIVDVDYEYDFVTGMNIMLYTRVVGSSDTVLVRYPYHDYFYIEITPTMGCDKIKKAIKGYCWFLRKKYKEMADNPRTGVDMRRHQINMNDVDHPYIVSYEVIDDLNSMYGYQPDAQQFLKITTANPTVTSDLFKGLSKKYIGGKTAVFKYDGSGTKYPNGEAYFPEMRFFEANTDVVNKFSTAHGISGCATVNVSGVYIKNVFSTCTMAIDGTHIEPAGPDAPFYTPRTFFYDIECLALDINVFPTSDRCPVIQISYVCVAGRETVSSGVLCLHETPGYEWFETEGEVLIMFAKKIIDFNPDYLTGFNSNSFDMPYIIDRMKVLGVYDIAGEFSRRKGFLVDYKRDFKTSKQFGTKEVVKYTTPGRVMFDQMETIQNNPMIKLRSYSLKSICAEYLGDDNNKEDMPYREIPDHFKTPSGRVKIASYCLQDSVLLKMLDDKMMMGIDVAGQAKVHGITANTVLNRGLVFRIMCKVKQYTERYKFLIPTFNKQQFPVSPTYKGATVINCIAGYYTDPVSVLDFEALYPSTIRCYNLCYTTISLDAEQVAKYPERFQAFGNGYYFVKNEYHRGIIPRIEADLHAERKNAKKKMKQAEDPVDVAVWNAIQGGVKTVMNSIYGLCGSPTAAVPCVPIAATITYMGRVNLAKSKEYVEANYCRLTGETVPARVIYGDTVSFGPHIYLLFIK
jgi:DNA polymerase elongation subunit (family B)